MVLLFSTLALCTKLQAFEKLAMVQIICSKQVHAALWPVMRVQGTCDTMQAYGSDHQLKWLAIAALCRHSIGLIEITWYMHQLRASTVNTVKQMNTDLELAWCARAMRIKVKWPADTCKPF